MAVSQIEEKILGRLAQQIPPSSELNILLSSSLFRVLGLSIQLSKRLNKARQTRKLDFARDTKSLRLYHHIVWLAQEGLRMTEYDILHNLQSNVQGPEYRVMAAKMRASMHHVLCLFEMRSTLNSPVDSINASPTGSSRNAQGPNTNGQQQVRSPTKRSPSGDIEGTTSRRRKGKAALRDPILSMTSDTSYVTNPYAAGLSSTPPPPAPANVIDEARRTPVLPPGLTPVKEEANKTTNLASPGNDIAMAARYFAQAQLLADSLLAAPNAIRLSLTLEHAIFLWDCAKEPERAQKIARRAIRAVYRSSDGLDDDEFRDASELVQALAGIVKRGQSQLSSQLSSESAPSPDHNDSRPRPLAIDRTIALSPTNLRNHARSPANMRTKMRTPERLSTVPEVESVAEEAQTQATMSPTPLSSSRPTSRIPQRRTSSTTTATSDKASRRRLVQEAEAEQSSRQNSVRSDGAISSSTSRPHSRQATPPDGISTLATARVMIKTTATKSPSIPSTRVSPPHPAPHAPKKNSIRPAPSLNWDDKQPDKGRSHNNNRSSDGKEQQQQQHDHAAVQSEPRQNTQRIRSPLTSTSPAVDDRRQAIRRTLSILSSSAAKSLGGSEGKCQSSRPHHGTVKSSVRIV